MSAINGICSHYSGARNPRGLSIHAVRVTLKLLSGARTNDVGHILLTVQLTVILKNAFTWFEGAHYDNVRIGEILISASVECISVWSALHGGDL